MKFTKEKILSLVKQNITEMAMDFDTPDRPASDLQQKLQANDTPLTKVHTCIQAYDTNMRTYISYIHMRERERERERERV